MGGAWLSLHIWEHYCFTLDFDFLKEFYPVLAEAALFFVDTLIPDRDGRLRVSPSLSPENVYRLPNGQTGSLCDDAAMDQQILYELFAAAIQGGELLGRDVDVYRALIGRLRPWRSLPMEGFWSGCPRINRRSSPAIAICLICLLCTPAGDHGRNPKRYDGGAPNAGEPPFSRRRTHGLEPCLDNQFLGALAGWTNGGRERPAAPGAVHPAQSV